MTDLTDRMRTCAAFIMGRPHEADTQEDMLLKDAAELLVEAAHLIDMTPAPPGEPMEIIPPIEIKPKPPAVEGTWLAPGSPMPTSGWRSPRACPKCDSRAQKTVLRKGTHLWLACPVCATQWEYKP